MRDDTEAQGLYPWEELAHAPYGDAEISEAEIMAIMPQNIEAIHKEVDALRNMLTVCARNIAHTYWESSNMDRDPTSKEGRGFYGTRARRQGNTLNIEWYRNQIVNAESGRTTRAKPVRKGNGWTYKRSAFRSAKDWEYQLIRLTEQDYIKIRKLWRKVTELASSVRSFEQLLEKTVSPELDEQGD